MVSTLALLLASQGGTYASDLSVRETMRLAITPRLDGRLADEEWDRFAVVMRSATQQVRTLDYVAAAQAAGASTARVLLGEVLPNVLPHLIVVATLEAASAILLEAALSFLGLGVQPPLPSWGLMISEAKSYMFFSFWLIALPGAALAVLIFAINLAGDGLRDLLAPEGRA